MEELERLILFVMSLFHSFESQCFVLVAPSAARYLQSGQIKSVRLAAGLGQKFRGRPWHRLAQIMLRSDRTDRFGTLKML